MALSGLRAVLPGLLLLALQSIPIAAIALERTALVVGNSAYRDAPLSNPVNDATDVARVLEKQLGFDVILRTDVTQQQFDAAAREFRQRLQRRGGVGLFYYAGHGIQVDGHNYLIPVGANIDSETDVKYKAVDAGYVLGKMDEADASLNIVILDACRNNPFERSFRSASRGLVRLELPAGELGSLLAYSTAPGKVAADGSGRNSPYTKHLLRALRQPDENIYRVFQKARIGVYKETNGQQIPWVSESLLGDFYFLRSQAETIAKAPPKVMPTPPEPPKQAAILTVRSNVYGDQVYIDGQELGSTRLDVELAPGRHSVRVEKEGYLPYEKTVELEAGRDTVMRATLSRETVAVQPARSDDLLSSGIYNVVRGSGFDELLLGGTVTVDRRPGEKHGTLEIALQLPSGRYVYRVETRVERNQLQCTIIDTNDSEYLGHSFMVTMTRVGNQYSWVDNAGRRMTLERQ